MLPDALESVSVRSMVAEVLEPPAERSPLTLARLSSPETLLDLKVAVAPLIVFSVFFLMSALSLSDVWPDDLITLSDPRLAVTLTVDLLMSSSTVTSALQSVISRVRAWAIPLPMPSGSIFTRSFPSWGPSLYVPELTIC